MRLTDDLFTYILIGVGWFLGWLQRNAKSRRRWKLIRETARAELDSPEGTNDPETAIVKATLSVNRPRIQSETQRLRVQAAPSAVLTGNITGRTPRLESEDDSGTTGNGKHET